ncbi:MAG: ZIP family metal transporter [Sterolibacteriaceae bacterium]|nr:ZIP family metal transporter [Sterolibacteriaceae bacterium]MBK9085183.1 ZIP family metal transporter [Sterolibacteriaceae bacterium]
MSPLYWIIAASLAGGLLSVVAAAAFTYSLRPHWVHHLVSYAIGALLGAAFLEVMPHALSTAGDTKYIAGLILAGILLFFVLEKLVLWRHCHEDQCEAHEHVELHDSHGHAEGDRGRSGALIMIGDTFHNFVDGVLIAAAFMESVPLGLVTATAMIAHEIPQEIGDFVILLHSGYSRARALLFNMLSSLATLVGGVLAYVALPMVDGAVPVLLALACSSMIYVAVADLIPGLHRRPQLGATVQQVGLIGLGILSISGVHLLVDGLGLVQ